MDGLMAAENSRVNGQTALQGNKTGPHSYACGSVFAFPSLPSCLPLFHRDEHARRDAHLTPNA